MSNWAAGITAYAQRIDDFLAMAEALHSRRTAMSAVSLRAVSGNPSPHQDERQLCFF
jgi:hypothetical protein